MHISKAKKNLEKILEKLSVDVKKIEVVAGEPHTILSITTSDSGLLIGANGENLRALNYLVKKITESYGNDTDRLSFLVDVNGYHRKHINELKNQAGILADRARTFKSDIPMNPLNSYERLIVHSFFANDPDIYTESAGIGKNRHIMFRYKNSKEQTIVSDKELFGIENE